MMVSERSLTDPGAEPTLGASRRRVLDVLRSTDGPVAVQRVAENTDLHPNTARFHLDGLVAAGLAEREAEERGNPGRPRMVYRAAAGDAAPGQRSYRLLAEMLTTLVADTMPQSEQGAIAAGQAWGRYLADRPAPSHRVDGGDSLRRLSTVLTKAGFAPGPVDDETNPVLPLRHCPFLESAAHNRELVCSLHLGLMRGVLAEVRAPLQVDQLEPFVEPSLCLAHLSPARGLEEVR